MKNFIEFEEISKLNDDEKSHYSDHEKSNLEETNMNEERKVYTVRNMATGQRYHTTKYPSSAATLVKKIRLFGGNHIHAKVFANETPVDDHELIKENLGEAMISYHDFASKVAAHKKAGSDVTSAQYTPKKAQYTIVDKEGTARRITHTEAGSKLENLGQHKGDIDDKEKSTKKEPEVKKGRGRPAGSKSGAEHKVQTKGSGEGADYIGYKIHLPNQNR